MTAITTGMALAAGLGTRMRPLTDDRPKALVEVGGKALLDHALDRFAAAGVSRTVVNIHHLADRMRAHIEARSGSPEIVISDETDALLETGGGMVKALPLLGEDPVLVSNIDAVWVDRGTPELSRLMQAWDEARMDVLLLLAPMEQTLGFDGAGDFFLGDDGRLDWRGDRTSAPYAYAGAHIVHPRVFAGESVRRFSLTGIWKRLSTEGRLHGLPMKAFWMHVGDPRARDEAEARLAAGMM
ncbi:MULTISPECIES: nucleotidyltransferase family protein [Hyphobacterium]|uniref:Nucleotidyltransferase family protein n=1 Tax=Hyphobacterium vulgare TaxID=1736751 RepID=A0ABV6ZXZ3_9PROT